MVDIHVIGCGGVGSWIVHFIRRAFPDHKKVLLHLWDQDTVEEKNLPHCNFHMRDIGKQKSEVLASRYRGYAYGNWNGEYLSGIIICAVDDLSTRKRIINEFADSYIVIDVRAEGKSWQVFLGSSKLIGTFVSGRNPDERRGCQNGNLIPDFGNVVAAAYVAQVVKSILTRQPLPRSEWWGEVLGEAGKIEVQGGGDITPATCCICGSNISRGAVDKDGAVYCPSCSPSFTLPVGEVGMMGDRPVLILENKLKEWKEIVQQLKNLPNWKVTVKSIREVELRTEVLCAFTFTPIGVRYLGPIPFIVQVEYDGGVSFRFITHVPRCHPHLDSSDGDICWGQYSKRLINSCPADFDKIVKALENNLTVFKQLLSDGMNEGYYNPVICLFSAYTVSKPYKTVEEFQQLLKEDPIYKYVQRGGRVPYDSRDGLRLLQRLLKEEEAEEVFQVPQINWREVARYYQEHPLTPQQPQQQLEQAEEQERR